jgi:O-antigen ligase
MTSSRKALPPELREANFKRVLPLTVVAATALALGAIDVSLLLATIATLLLFLLALRDLSLGVLSVVASVPVQSVAALDLGVAGVTWTKLAVLALLIAWAVRLLSGYSRPRIDDIAAALGVYILVLTISIVEARNLSAWAGEVYRWAVSLAIYVAAAESLRGTVALRRVALVLSAAVVAVAAYAGWQVASGTGPATFSVGGVTRAYATFGEPNPFAGYLEMTVPLLLALAIGFAASGPARPVFQPLGKLALVAIFVASIAGILALLATQSRGGYLGFAVGLGTIVWLTGGKVRWLGTVGGVICLVAILASPASGSVTERFRTESFTTKDAQVTTDNFAAQERAAHWRAAIHMAESSPILGVGAGNFDERYREATTVWRFRIPRGHAHNAYLQALAQAGILGAVSYLSVLVAVAWRIRRELKRAHDPVIRSVAIGVAAITAAVAVHNTVESLHVLSLGLQLAVVWALLHLDREPRRAVTNA